MSTAFHPPPAGSSFEGQGRVAVLQNLPVGTLLINEIFASIQGETSCAGLPCVFVRTAGCQLRCTYCDTRFAYTDGEVMNITAILERVRSFGLPLVMLTGGEPLLQPAVIPLLKHMCDEGLSVLLETNGSLDIRPVDPRVVRIMDLKTPGSGEVAANLPGNVEALRGQDQIKIVITDRHDYEWARDRMRELDLARCCPVLMSPAYDLVRAADLAAWILADRLPVRLQVQLHKIIWEPNRRGV